MTTAPHTLNPADLPDAATAFLGEYHLATLSTLRPDGPPHVVAVGFTWDAAARKARVITSGGTQKVVNAARGGYATICQLDGRRWISLSGRVRVLDDPESVADAVARYAQRYRPPRVNPIRVVLEIDVDQVLASTDLR